jgi:hypothetical protein
MFLVLMALRVVIGIQLMITGYRHRLPNLYWLAAQFFLFALMISLVPTDENPLSGLPASLWVFMFANYLSQITLLAFNQTTFYQNKPSPFKWYAAILIIFTAISFYGLALSESNFNQHPLTAFFAVSMISLWIWQGWSAYQAHSIIAQEYSVEDWIKSRYQIIGAYSIAMCIGATAAFIRTFVEGGSMITPFGATMGGISMVAQLIAVLLQYLVWVLPEGFRKWLNRNQQAHTQEHISEQAHAVLNILGTAMTEDTGLSKMLAVFSIRKVIGMQIQSEDTVQIDARVASMGFNEWLEVLNNPELYILIKNSGAKIDPVKVLGKAKQALIEKQSLFTMKAK